MRLEKRIRVIELRAAIAALCGDAFADPAELQLRAEKVAELEQLQPTAPPYPNKTTDLDVTRESLVEDVERRKRKAEPILTQLERETDEKRIYMLRFNSDQYQRYVAALDRLERFDKYQVWKLWDAEQREKLQAEQRDAH
jgi:hypothetical protein